MTRAKLTIDKLQSHARMLSNSCFTRYWAHYNWPQNPVQMAIAIKDDDGNTASCHDLERANYEKQTTNGNIIYICDRINSDGTPYVSKLL